MLAETAAAQHAYSIDEFRAAFSIGRSVVYEEIRTGRLRARKVGSRTLIAREDAIEWLRNLPVRESRRHHS
jgi:excisionase family DNA binding protein